MAFKAVLFCASALLVQSISCCPSSQGYGSCGSLFSSTSSNMPALSSGGDFPVTSIGPIVPNGISLDCYQDLYGDVKICGTMPFLAGVEFATELPTSGSGCVDYSCGSGSNVAITGVTGSGSQSYSCYN